MNRLARGTWAAWERAGRRKGNQLQIGIATALDAFRRTGISANQFCQPRRVAQPEITRDRALLRVCIDQSRADVEVLTTGYCQGGSQSAGAATGFDADDAQGETLSIATSGKQDFGEDLLALAH